MVVPLDRETLLDLSVNLIPLGMLFLFVLLFLVYSPWQGGGFELGISIALTLIPFLFLALITYVSGAVIQKEEEQSSDSEPV